MTNIFVGNLRYEVTEQDLPPVDNYRRSVPKISGRNDGYATENHPDSSVARIENHRTVRAADELRSR
jgi:hypothetical protein